MNQRLNKKHSESVNLRRSCCEECETVWPCVKQTTQNVSEWSMLYMYVKPFQEISWKYGHVLSSNFANKHDHPTTQKN